ncbi:MAG: hypothetical protein QGG36_22010 [Pirellulaceae bacterium]|jgi:hypothetical protein|nr:hypothetical protein [Pirellulaceae bacterium]MDP7018496.1 hypothetical protein [Pirellulaceae bacterium]
MLFDDLSPILDLARTLRRARNLAFFTLAALLAQPQLVAEDSGPVSFSRQPKSAYRQIKLIFEARGELKMNEDGRRVRRVPLEARGDLLFDERLLENSDQRQRMLRSYEEVDVRLKIGDGQLKPQLSKPARLVQVQQSADRAALLVRSPHGPLTRDELDLVRIHGDSVTWDNLLPDGPIAIDQTWLIEHPVLAQFLLLDAITEGEVKGRLQSVEADVALLEISGSISGAIGGVATEVDLRAKLNYDLAARQLSWLALTIKENRTIGHAEPGLEVTSRLRIAAKPLVDSPRLTDKALDGLPTDPLDPAADVLRFQSPKGKYEIYHDPRWRMMVDRSNVTIFRFVDRGDLIAQCNVSSLDRAPAGKQLPIEAFRDGVRETLGERLQQFVEVSTSQGERGYRVHRVVAAGTVSELPIHWVYYHITAPDGRRASVVFTLEAPLVERFGGGDRTLVNAFRFAESE